MINFTIFNTPHGDVDILIESYTIESEVPPNRDYPGDLAQVSSVEGKILDQQGNDLGEKVFEEILEAYVEEIDEAIFAYDQARDEEFMI